nr:cytochrome c oxidase subunit 4 [Cryptococcus depauperatus CBS 7855]
MVLLKVRSLTTSARRYAAAAPLTVTSTRSNASAPLLGNIEASWKTLPAEEQYEIYQQLEQIQKKDWKQLTVDEKKAAYFVSFGPHGPRAPTVESGHGLKVLLGVSGAVIAGFALFSVVRTQAAPPPKTMTAEYQEQMTEYMKSQNMNPIASLALDGRECLLTGLQTGISSEGYKGKGMVQSN